MASRTGRGRGIRRGIRTGSIATERRSRWPGTTIIRFLARMSLSVECRATISNCQSRRHVMRYGPAPVPWAIRPTGMCRWRRHSRERRARRLTSSVRRTIPAGCRTMQSRSERQWFTDGRPLAPLMDISDAAISVSGQLYRVTSTTTDGDNLGRVGYNIYVVKTSATTLVAGGNCSAANPCPIWSDTYLLDSIMQPCTITLLGGSGTVYVSRIGSGGLGVTYTNGLTISYGYVARFRRETGFLGVRCPCGRGEQVPERGRQAVRTIAEVPPAILA